MGMNIKNPEAHRLAAELAASTGESLSTAVTIAVRERLERVRRAPDDDLAGKLLAIGRDCAEHLPAAFRAADHDAWLYDERGLPR